MNRLMIDFPPNGFNIPTLTELPLRQVQAMSIQTKIEIIKGLMENVAKDATVKLLVPRAYWLFAEEFKAVDDRIKAVARNPVNGFSVIELDSEVADGGKTEEVSDGTTDNG